VGVSTQGYRSDIQLRSKEELIYQAHEELGITAGNRLLRESYPAYFWDLIWIKKDIVDIIIEEDESSRDEQIIRDISFQFDTQGRLIHFNRNIPDTLNLPVLDKIKARQLAYQFLESYVEFKTVDEAAVLSDFILDNQNNIIEGNEDELEQVQNRIGDGYKRTDYNFKWMIHLPQLANNVELKVTVAGNLISKFEIDYNVPQQYQHEENKIALGLSRVLLVILIAIIVIVIAFKKSRAYEISFKIAWKLGVFITLLYGIDVFFTMSRVQGWELIFTMIIVPLFVGGPFVFAWAVSESVGRETWKDKFIPLDLLTKGHLFHSKIGEGIFKGLTFGSISVLVLLALTWIASQTLPLQAVISGENKLDLFASFRPGIRLLTHAMWASMYILAIHCMFIVSFVYSKTARRNITFILAAIPLAIMMGGGIRPVYIGLIIESVAFGIFIWVYYRYDLLTAFSALFTFTIIFASITFATATNIEFITTGYIFIFLTILVFGYATLTIFSKDSVQDFSSIEPAIAKFISERQRMRQQLEVAREVQKSFLPQNYPIFRGLDLAAKCVPALEVGGDYFDFLKLSNHRLGVVIGDVSGKGTRAAFYMTLVKGFLKALSRITYSPGDILKEMNTLFFENAKRDAFISMVYGVFDMEEKILTLARSGHNPVIVHRTGEQELETIITDGLALGLEKGALFNRLMQESKIPLKSGNLFVFYTDGFTEARNKKNEEFGEERFLEAIKKYSDAAAERVLEGIFAEVMRFARGVEQHDDMTMVVVKVV
jgi:serine phosphatase RsbU (regulator of sigma subunit)